MATKERRELVDVGPGSPGKEVVSVLLHVAESLSKLRTEFIVSMECCFNRGDQSFAFSAPGPNR